VVVPFLEQRRHPAVEEFEEGHRIRALSVHEPQQQAHHGRLSRTVRPEENVYFSRPDTEIEAAEGTNGAEGLDGVWS